MSIKNILIVLGFFVAAALPAQAQEVWGKGGGVSYSMAGIEGGFKWNSADVTGSTSNKQIIGFQIGGSAVFDLAENFGIKTGLFYTERPFKNSAPGIEGTGKITYFDVPVLAMFKFADHAGVYAGPSFAMKLGDEYSTTPSGNGTLTSIKGTIIPLTIGAQFKMTPALGLNIFFETVSGELAAGLENSRAVGANVLFTFD
jgi:Outer membrane protein beta-barrel domain